MNPVSFREAFRIFGLHFFWAGVQGVFLNISEATSFFVVLLPGTMMGLVFIHLHRSIEAIARVRFRLIILFSVTWLGTLLFANGWLEGEKNVAPIPPLLVKGLLGTTILLVFMGVLLNRFFRWYWYVLILTGGALFSILFFKQAEHNGYIESYFTALAFAGWQGGVGVLLGLAVRKTFPHDIAERTVSRSVPLPAVFCWQFLSGILTPVLIFIHPELNLLFLIAPGVFMGIVFMLVNHHIEALRRRQTAILLMFIGVHLTAATLSFGLLQIINLAELDALFITSLFETTGLFLLTSLLIRKWLPLYWYALLFLPGILLSSVFIVDTFPIWYKSIMITTVLTCGFWQAGTSTLLSIMLRKAFPQSTVQSTEAK